MTKSEELDQRLARLAVSRQQSWEAVREAQSFVRAGIANFERRRPPWVKPTPPEPDVTPPPQPVPPLAWYERIPTRIWNSLPILIGTVLGLLLADWLGAW